MVGPILYVNHALPKADIVLRNWEGKNWSKHANKEPQKRLLHRWRWVFLGLLHRGSTRCREGIHSFPLFVFFKICFAIVCLIEAPCVTMQKRSSRWSWSPNYQSAVSATTGCFSCIMRVSFDLLIRVRQVNLFKRVPKDRSTQFFTARTPSVDSVRETYCDLV